MIEVLVTLVPSLLWIFYRCFRLWTTPIEELIDDLQIEIPHSPSVCIDSILKDAAIIHWDIEILPDELLNYILLIDSKQVAGLSSTSCKLTNLVPGQIYEIQIIAENSLTNFRSQSCPVFIQSLEGEIKDLNEEIPSDNDSTLPEKNSVLSHDVSVDVDVDSLSVERIKAIKSSEILNEYLNKFQVELSKINQEYQKYKAFIENESREFNEQLKFYKQEFDEETNSKLKKDNDVKALEKTKNELTFSKSKLLSQLSTIQHSVDLFNRKLDEYDVTVKKLTKKNADALNHEPEEIAAIMEQIKSLDSQINCDKIVNEKLEEDIKHLVNEKKEMAQLVTKLKPYIDVINNPPINNDSTVPATIFTKVGTIQKQVADAISYICEIMPSWSADITEEIEHYNNEDTKWKATFRQEIKKYVDIHQLVEIAKKRTDPLYQPVKITEYQASIDFGGFANALPRIKTNGLNGNKVHRNFSPQTSISSSGVNEEPNFYNHYGQVYSREKVNGNDSNGNNSFIEQLNGLDSIDQSIDQAIDTQYANPLQPQPEVFVQSPVPSNHDAFIQPALTTTGVNTQALGFPYDDEIYSTNLNQEVPMYNGDNSSAYGYDLNSLLYSYTSPRLPNNNLTPVARTPIPPGSQPLLQTQSQILPQSAPVVWNPTPHHLGVNDLFNNSNVSVNSTNVSVNNPSLSTSTPLEHSQSQYLTSNIWNGRDDMNGHTRNLSNNQIWRNDNNLVNHNFNLGEFQPFGNSINLSGSKSEEKKRL